MIALTLFTGHWTTLYRANPTDVVPVRTSVGVPRFWSEAKGFPQSTILTPAGLTKIKAMDVFTLAYERKLEKAGGVEAIYAELNGIAQEYCKPLVLMCFEKDPKDCHRGVFARWWQEQTGDTINEWSATAE